MRAGRTMSTGNRNEFNHLAATASANALIDPAISGTVAAPANAVAAPAVAVIASAVVAILGAGEAYAQGTLEEVIVTAQKRVQNAQDVPITMTTLTGEEITDLGFETAADVQYQTPGLIVSYSSTNAIPNFVLRGVGLNDFTAIQSSPVAVHVDEVYYGNSTMLNFLLFDIERVEVLKGPQGTLYGRNSTGGSVNFFANQPTEEFEGGLDLGIGNYSSRFVEGFVGGALGDGVSGRFSFNAVNQGGGPFEHPTLGEIGQTSKHAFRGQLLWDGSDDLSVQLTVFGGSDDSDGNQYHGIASYTNDGSFEICPSVDGGSLRASPDCSFDGFGRSIAVDDDPFTLQNGVVNRDAIDAFGAVLKIERDLGFATLSSITGYNTLDRKSQEDADGSVERNIDVGYETEFSQFTEELRLSSPGDNAWTWTLGLFYSTDDLVTPRTETDLADLFGGFRQNHAYELATDSFALFWHNEYALSDTVSLIGGLRFTDESRSFVGGTINVAAGQGPTGEGDFVASPGPLPGNFSDHSVFDEAFLDDEIGFSEPSWTIGVRVDTSDSTMVYGTVSNGFKSGGFVGDITLDPILNEPYDAETLTAYEAGIKADLLGAALRWNTSVFFYDYQDIILALTLTDTGELGLDTFLINENGANADVSGVESEIWWAPSDYVDIKLGATWLSTEQESIPTSPFRVSELLDGSELPYAPGFSANGLIRYERPVSNALLGFAQFDFTARADYFGEATNAPLTLLEGYTLYNVRLGVEPEDGAWSVNVWGKNLADEGYFQYVNDLSSLGSILTTPGLPRTYGMDFSLRF